MIGQEAKNHYVQTSGWDLLQRQRVVSANNASGFGMNTLAGGKPVEHQGLQTWACKLADRAC